MTNKNELQDIVWTQRNRSGRHWFTAVFSMFLLGASIGMLQTASGIWVVPISKKFGVSRGEASFFLSQTGYILTCLYIVAGFLMKKLKRSWWITLAMMLGAGGCFLASAAESFKVFTIIPFMLAFTEAFNGAGFNGALQSNWFEKRFGAVMGMIDLAQCLIGAAWGIGGSIIIERYGLNASFRFVGIWLGILAVISIFFYRFRPEEVGKLPYGAQDNGQEIIAIAQAKAEETKAAENALPGATLSMALKSPAYWLILLFIAVGISFCAFNSTLPGFAMEFGAGTVLAGSITSISLIGRMFGSLLSGTLFDKYGMKRAFILGLLIGFAGMILLAIHANMFCIAVGAFLLGSFMGVPVIGCAFIVKTFMGRRNFEVLSMWGNVVMALFFSIFISLFNSAYDKTGTYMGDIWLMILLAVVTLAVVLLIDVFGKQFQKKWKDKEAADFASDN